MPRWACVCVLFLVLATTACVRPEASTVNASGFPAIRGQHPIWGTPAAAPASPQGPAPAGPPQPPQPPPAPPVPPLPRGGVTFFPQQRVVAYYGTAGTDRLGVLGAGTPDQAGDRLEQAAAPFATPGRSVLPAMELIATVANSTPGKQGDYSSDIDMSEAQSYLDAARRHHQLLIIDIQPGSSDFLSASRVWEPLLRQPDVSLALDPEWRMAPGEVPGTTIGSVSSAEVNQVSAWLAGIVREGHLPQKLFVVHQFVSDEITAPEALATPPELASVLHIDGFGAPANKLSKYAALQRPAQLHLGFKLFYTQDTPTLTPAQTLGLQPPPDLVTYQ